MKFIEIQEGTSINVEQIESIKRNSDTGGSTITMESGEQHDTAFQYIQLLQIIEIELELKQKKGMGEVLEGQFHGG